MGNNVDMDEDIEDRREFRRRRRKRNQLISYAVIAVILIGIGVGAFFGISTLVNKVNDERHAQELAAQLEELAAQQEEPVAVEAPVETTVPETEEKSLLDEIVDSCIAEMPLEDKVAGLFIITPEALTDTDAVIKAGDTTKERLNAVAIGGLVYFSKNMKSEEQLTEMLNTTTSMSKYPIFLCVDEEGGEVSRLKEAGISVTDVGDMSAIGAAGDTTKAAEAGTTIGTYLSNFGFNVDFAPVADVLSGTDNTVIGNRSFGTDASVVGSMVAAETEAMESVGVSACLKHFPGLGDTTEDTHEGMANTEKTLDDMRASDFVAFQAGIDAGADFVMVSHLSAANVIGDNTPCSLSGVMITDTLRNELGFQGIVVTDALNMTAITDYYSSAEASVQALTAGADMLLMPENYQEAYQGVLDAVNDGTLTEERINESLRRIYRVKYADKVEQ